MKYSAAGGVLLTCRLAGGAPRHWRVEVWDTGSGIAAVDRERIFDEFFQIDPVPGERRGGLGLGLSIVRRLAGMLGHPLRLDSVVGRGSRFALIVPAATASSRVVESGPPAGSIEGLGIGVLDDDPQVCDAMQTLLERWGCRVCKGTSAAALMAAAGERAAGKLQVLIVDLDLDLPGSGGGLDAIRTLRRACATDAPALIVTGASSPERLAELQASGFDWLIKPVPPARLRSWLIVAARRARQQHAADATEPRPDVPAETS